MGKILDLSVLLAVTRGNFCTNKVASMPDFAVSDEKKRHLLEKMESLDIREEDLEEKFIRSSGKGGQHVNKSSTCVYLKHIPTGVEVKCMRDRSQSVNRFLARREIVEKIELLSGVRTVRDIRSDKIRRNKAKRKKRANVKYPAESGSGVNEKE
jgi:protein subunit release factor B